MTQLLYQLKDLAHKKDRSDAEDFFLSCLAWINVSNSQNFQDVWAMFESGKTFTPGFFVDFGATDGVTGSNTAMLWQLGIWEGILAEPNPNFWPALDRIRTKDIKVFKGAVSTKDGTDVLRITDEPDLSTLVNYTKIQDEHHAKRQSGKEVSVETLTLKSLLDQYEAPDDIDFLSIDTEGSEYDILNQFFGSNEKYKIGLITVEHNFIPDKRIALAQLLAKYGYTRKFTEFSRWDDFYIHKDYEKNGI